jgi:hypothetical protein
MPKSTTAWFLILTAVCAVAPYLLGVPARTARERLYLAITIAFLAWILLLMAPLR